MDHSDGIDQARYSFQHANLYKTNQQYCYLVTVGRKNKGIKRMSQIWKVVLTGSLLYRGSQNFSRVYRNFTLSRASLARSVILLSCSCHCYKYFSFFLILPIISTNYISINNLRQVFLSTTYYHFYKCSTSNLP